MSIEFNLELRDTLLSIIFVLLLRLREIECWWFSLVWAMVPKELWNLGLNTHNLDHAGHLC